MMELIFLRAFGLIGRIIALPVVLFFVAIGALKRNGASSATSSPPSPAKSPQAMKQANQEAAERAFSRSDNHYPVADRIVTQMLMMQNRCIGYMALRLYGDRKRIARWVTIEDAAFASRFSSKRVELAPVALPYKVDLEAVMKEAIEVFVSMCAPKVEPARRVERRSATAHYPLQALNQPQTDLSPMLSGASKAAPARIEQSAPMVQLTATQPAPTAPVQAAPEYLPPQAATSAPMPRNAGAAVVQAPAEPVKAIAPALPATVAAPASPAPGPSASIDHEGQVYEGVYVCSGIGKKTTWDKTEKKSKEVDVFYIDLQISELGAINRVWGTDLERCVQESNLQVGTAVRITRMGSSPVNLPGGRRGKKNHFKLERI